MKLLLIILSLSTLVACKEIEKYQQADKKVLCDPKTGDAYYAEVRFGVNSTVERNPNLDELCQKN